MSRLTSRQLKKDKMPFILMGAGILALIIFFFVLFPKEQEPPEDSSVRTSSGDKAGDIEYRLSKLEWISERVSRLEDRDKVLETIEGRLDRLEESISSRMEEMEKRLEYIEKKSSVSRPRTTESSRAAKVPETRKPRTVKRVGAGARYHIVHAGETLYQISRSYGISVDELRRLNNLAPGTPIRPGQRLLLNQGN
ncbi:LysM peptidoglycan-binding domain-containing protein [Desulfococcaceae bacterium HSG8]|nr:LysM peptidoglycan-binding domain-containing protein [Desulfococcaceae bacterium HSG8]